MKKLLISLLLCLAVCALLTACGQKTCEITFVVDGVSHTQTVEIGQTPVFEGSTDKPISGEERYVFTGWFPALKPAEADATYTALYETKSAKTYEVLYKILDGEISSTVYEGEIPVPPAEVTADQETQYTYERFKSFNTELQPATEDTMYVVRYTSELKQFEITFDVDGKKETKTVTAKQLPAYSGGTPVKAGHIFLGWDSPIVIAGGNVTYTAVFSPLTTGDKYRITLSEKGLADAVGQGLSGYTMQNGQKTGPWNAATSLFFLLVEEHDNPGLPYVRDWILKEIRVLIKGGNEPDMAHGAQWSFATVSSAMAMAKNTPSVWNELTAEEKERLDFWMKLMVYTSAFEMNDSSNYTTTPLMQGNFNKNWNPNFRCVGLIPLLAGKAYFGSAKAIDDILLAFDYDATVAKLQAYGYSNALQTYQATTKEIMEGHSAFTTIEGKASSGEGVKHAFTYYGFTLDEPEKILNHLLDYTYSVRTVSKITDSSNPDLYGYIAGDKTSPMEGRMGMITELAGGDAGGLRSSAAYSMADFHMETTALTLLISLGYYDPATDMDRDLMNRVYVGNTDLLFKLREGYYNCSNGKRETEPFQYGYYGMQPLVAELWEEHLSHWIDYQKPAGFFVDYTNEKGESETVKYETADIHLKELPVGYVWYDGSKIYYNSGAAYQFPADDTLTLRAIRGSIAPGVDTATIVVEYEKNLVLAKDSANDVGEFVKTDLYKGWLMVDVVLSVDDPKYIPSVGNVQYKHTGAANPATTLLTFAPNGDIVACDEDKTVISNLAVRTHIVILYNTETGEVDIYNVAGGLLASFVSPNAEGTAGRLAYFYLPKGQAAGADGKERHLNIDVRIGYGFDKPCDITYTEDEIIVLSDSGTTLDALPDGYIWFDGNSTFYRPGATFKFAAGVVPPLIPVRGSIAEGKDTATVIQTDSDTLVLAKDSTNDTSHFKPSGVYSGWILLDLTLSTDAPAYFPAGSSAQYKHLNAANPATGLFSFAENGDIIAAGEAKTVIGNFLNAPAHIYVAYDTISGEIRYFDADLKLLATDARQKNELGTAGRLLYFYMPRFTSAAERHLTFSVTIYENLDGATERTAAVLPQ